MRRTAGAPPRISRHAKNAEAIFIEKLRLEAGMDQREWCDALGMALGTYRRLLIHGVDRSLLMLAKARMKTGDVTSVELLYGDLQSRLKEFVRKF